MKLTIQNLKKIVGKVSNDWIVSNIEEEHLTYKIKCTNLLNGTQRLVVLQREFDTKEGGYRFIRADDFYGNKSHPYPSQSIADLSIFRSIVAYEIDYGFKASLI